MKDERMAWLTFHIETPVIEYAQKNPSFNDRDALLAMEYAREKIEKGRGLILIPDAKMMPGNALGEAVYQMIERCRYEERIIMTGKPQAYTAEEKLNVLDRIIETLKHLAGSEMKGRSYIQAVTERFARIKDLSRQKKIHSVK